MSSLDLEAIRKRAEQRLGERHPGAELVIVELCADVLAIGEALMSTTEERDEYERRFEYWMEAEKKSCAEIGVLEAERDRLLLVVNDRTEDVESLVSQREELQADLAQALDENARLLEVLRVVDDMLEYPYAGKKHPRKCDLEYIDSLLGDFRAALDQSAQPEKEGT